MPELRHLWHLRLQLHRSNHRQQGRGLTLTFLASLALQQEGVDAAELSRRITDQDPENWVSLDEARKRLSTLP